MQRVNPLYAQPGLRRHLDPPPNNEERDRYLQEMYTTTDSGGGYGGAKTLYNSVKKAGLYRISFDEIKDFLRSQESYAAFKRVKKHFKRPRVIVSEKNQQWDCDTLNMSFYRKSNRDYAYVLVCIDIFTRYAFTQPLKSLEASSLKEAFENIFMYNEPPKSIRTDSGSEFANSLIRSYFNELQIRFFQSRNEVKTNYSERLIQTLRVRMGRAMNSKNTFNWVDDLQQITQGYNESKHRSINCTPLEAMCLKDKALLWHWQYLRNDTATTTGPSLPFAFEVGDRVRLSFLPKTFRDRAYDEKVENVTDPR